MVSTDNDTLKAQLAELASSLQVVLEANNTLVDQNKDLAVEVAWLKLNMDSLGPDSKLLMSKKKSCKSRIMV